MRFLLPFLMVVSLFAISYENILALSWQNGFCKIKPYYKVCRNKKKIDYFVLHGLWPKKNYCAYKPFNLSYRVEKLLEVYMPSARYSLARHEWRKHGVCFGSDTDTYFLVSIKLTKEFNEKMKSFIHKNLGKVVTLSQFRLAFKKVFGYKTTRKFQLVCKVKNGVSYITEIRLNLKGDPLKESLKELLEKANNMYKKQCYEGVLN